VQTFWLSFSDPDLEPGHRFLGVTIVDVAEIEDQRHWGMKAIEKSWELGINPGGEVLICDVTNHHGFAEEHKNRLITDTVLIEFLKGSPSRYVN